MNARGSRPNRAPESCGPCSARGTSQSGPSQWGTAGGPRADPAVDRTAACAVHPGCGPVVNANAVVGLGGTDVAAGSSASAAVKNGAQTLPAALASTWP